MQHLPLFISLVLPVLLQKLYLCDKIIIKWSFLLCQNAQSISKLRPNQQTSVCLVSNASINGQFKAECPIAPCRWRSTSALVVEFPKCQLTPADLKLKTWKVGSLNALVQYHTVQWDGKCAVPVKVAHLAIAQLALACLSLALVPIVPLKGITLKNASFFSE